MSRKLQFTALAVALGLVAGACSEQADPTSPNDAGITSATTTANAGGGVVSHASLGGNDACEAFGLPPGCDANFSFVANQKADGSVKGQYQDQFAGGVGIHASINCLNVIGTQAWVSGTITGAFLNGLDVLTTVVDNGTSANDTPDQMSFSFIGTGIDCLAAPAFPLPLLNLTRGQVKVR